jgi:hypothetical protein
VRASKKISVACTAGVLWGLGYILVDASLDLYYLLIMSNRLCNHLSNQYSNIHVQPTTRLSSPVHSSTPQHGTIAHNYTTESRDKNHEHTQAVVEWMARVEGSKHVHR